MELISKRQKRMRHVHNYYLSLIKSGRRSYTIPPSLIKKKFAWFPVVVNETLVWNEYYYQTYYLSSYKDTFGRRYIWIDSTRKRLK